MNIKWIKIQGEKDLEKIGNASKDTIKI